MGDPLQRVQCSSPQAKRLLSIVNFLIKENGLNSVKDSKPKKSVLNLHCVMQMNINVIYKLYTV